MKIQFGISVVIFATGEADIDDNAQAIFTHPVKLVPNVVFFTPTPLPTEHVEILKTMALHQATKLALEKATPKEGIVEDNQSGVEINMNPLDGEKN